MLKQDEILIQPQVNEHNQITDKNVLNKERYRLGFVNTLFQGEETGLVPIHTIIVRALGGTALHIGFCGAFSCATSVLQWVGTLFLKRYNSNRKAMIAGLLCGMIVSMIVFGFILLAYIPVFKIYSLWMYLILGLILAGISGVLWNIETSWIGDLVPQAIRGWFTSAKTIVAVFGLLFFYLSFGKISDLFPSLITYSGFFILIAISHIIAIILANKITDRVPKNANFILSGSSHHERLNYKSMALWCYIIFFILWGSGRNAMLAFSTAYLIDCFQYSMTKVVLIFAIQNVICVILILILGKVSDKYGNRIPLLLISGTVSLCMLLWVSSAWWGVTPIIVYQVINGAAGNTHNMISINYGLEIFPAKGRAGYFGFSRVLIGASTLVAPIVGGGILQHIKDLKFLLWGTEINHYHLFFMVCSMIAFSSIVPLIIVKKRTVSVA